MNDKDALEFEDRYYVSPTVSRDEQMDFIDNYRKVLQDNVQRIGAQTHNLGTDVSSNIGGLTGAGPTFEARYITPQANAAVAELKAKAQATAMTQALNNLKAQMSKRYNDSYRNARISEYNKNNTPESPSELGVDTVDDEKKETQISTDGSEKGQYTAGRIYPVTDYVSDYLDANGQWWQIGPIKNTDLVPSAGLAPRNGEVRTTGGQSFMYIDNAQTDGGTWFRANQSAGPGTYSPKARG